MFQSSGTVSPEMLADYLSGKLGAAEMDAVEGYLCKHPEALTGLCFQESDRLEEKVRRAVKEFQIDPTDTLAPGLETAELSTMAAEIPIPPELRDHPRYQVLRQIGQGGMGAVYLAEHKVMRRLVALKVIRNLYVATPTTIDRFHREINAAARLNHPNIVAAYDAEQVGDTRFLVMEFVDGESLKDYMFRPNPLAIAEACDIVRQAALGLHHALEKGMVHRDIKPHNLMRMPDGA